MLPYFLKIKRAIGGSDLYKIYLSESTRKLGLSMIDVFIPIFLINIGYSLGQVAIYYLLYSVFHILFTLPAGMVSARFGVKYSILLSVPFHIIFFFLLFSLEFYHMPLVLLAITKGLAAGFFWVGRHTFMAQKTDHAKRGMELGRNKIIKKILSFPGPLVGGFILTLFNINIVLIFVFIFLVLSVIPIFFIKEKHEPVDLSVKHIFRGLNWREKTILITRGADDAMNDFVWPVFAFFTILNQYFILGIVKFIEKVFLMISDYLSGRAFDKRGSAVIKYGGFFSIFLWIGRTVVRTNLGVYVIDSFGGLIKPFIATGIDAECFELANSEDKVLHFIIAREILIHIGRVVLFGILYFVVDLKLMFLFGLVYSLVYIFVKFDGNRGKDAENIECVNFTN